MISIIIPALNEEEHIGKLLGSLQEKSSGHISEIIVADGGSSDRTREIAAGAGAKVVNCSRAQRSIQMNQGAASAESGIFYFLHADTFPPGNYDRMIVNAITKKNQAGCFRLLFDDGHPLLKMYGWFTRFRGTFLRYGDQSLFITRKLFEETGGFRADLLLMEDQEIISRIKKKTEFLILDHEVETSARKYRENGIVKLQLIFTAVFLFYRLGMKQETLAHLYSSLINSN